MGGDGDDSISLMLIFPRKMNQCLRTVLLRYLHNSRVKPQFLLLIYHIGSCDGIS